MSRASLASRRRFLKTAAGAAALFLPQPYAWVWAQTEGAVKLLRAPKLALVVGNSRYAMAPLVNPGNDARAVSLVLRGAGFDVATRIDAGRDELAQAVQDYTLALAKRQAVGIFYFAGHGLQLAWRNYMMPVDAEVQEAGEVPKRCVELGDLLAGIARAKNPLNVIILDACRDNPFGSLKGLDQKGLSQMDAPPSTMLAYATAPGNVASDGKGANGIYTENLVREMQVADARLEDVFKRVRLHVRLGTEGQQIPWESTSLEEDYYLIPPRAFTTLAAEQAARERQAELARLEKQREAEAAERQRKLEEARRLAQQEAEAAERRRREEAAALEAKRAAEEAERRYREEVAQIAQRAEAQRQKEMAAVYISKPNERDLERELAAELALWEKIKDATDIAPLQDYLLRYPGGRFTELAQWRLDRLLAGRGEQRVEIRSDAQNPFTKGTARANTAYRVGDTYVYRRLDAISGVQEGISNQRVTAVTDSEVIYNDGIARTDLLGNPLRLSDGTSYSPHQVVPAEFVVGKRWRTDYYITVPSGGRGPASLDVRIAARETVTVPAGSFNAYRIEARGWMSGAGRLNLSLQVTRWYAPDRLRRDVIVERRVMRSDGAYLRAERSELVSYSES